MNTSPDFSALSIEQTLYIHEQIIAYAGGVQGIRDFALLHSALERPKATFGGNDLYPTTLDKAAALLHSLVMNHAFLDGNKRTAFAITTRFLNLNNYRMTASQEQIVTLCLAVDNEGWQSKQIVAWLKKHTAVVS
jgi:death-on-curing protein